LRETSPEPRATPGGNPNEDGLELEAAGGSYGSLMKLNYYIVDITRLLEIREVRD
jgi:hypothetical protein